MGKAKRKLELHAFVAEDMARNTVAAIEAVVAPHAHVAFSTVIAHAGYWLVASDCTREQFDRAHDLAADVTHRARTAAGLDWATGEPLATGA